MTPQQRAARTRAINREGRRLYEEISKPAHKKVEKVLNGLLGGQNIRLRYTGPMRLKNGATGARLMKIDFGGLGFTVHIDGYKTVKHYASGFWEVA
jgi:hypothetical protein